MEEHYCHFIQKADVHPLHIKYHNQVYGFPLRDDDQLFGRLSLEIMQAGLSWLTVLKKEEAIEQAFSGFRISTAAQFAQPDIEELCAKPEIIRNKLKIKSIVHNARVIQAIQAEEGSFYQWLMEQGELDLSDWVRLFRKQFKFVGPEIINEFLMSTGFLPGAHLPDCPVYEEVQKQNPPYMRYRST